MRNVSFLAEAMRSFRANADIKYHNPSSDCWATGMPAAFKGKGAGGQNNGETIAIFKN